MPFDALTMKRGNALITRTNLWTVCASSQTRNNKRGQHAEINENGIVGFRKTILDCHQRLTMQKHVWKELVIDCNDS